MILSLCTMIFMFATLVTPRIINFRLATASASLRLMRSLRIYYSMLGVLVSSSYQTSFRFKGNLGTFSFTHPAHCMLDLELQSLITCIDRCTAKAFASPDY